MPRSPGARRSRSSCAPRPCSRRRARVPDSVISVPGIFTERLELLCDEWNSDLPLTAMHRAVLFGYLARYASNRLLIHDSLERHPQILAERIDRPVIVTGLPRSGTTHLVNLLAADARFTRCRCGNRTSRCPWRGGDAA